MKIEDLKNYERYWRANKSIERREADEQDHSEKECNQEKRTEKGNDYGKRI